jgi:hypothetical protein
VGPALGERPLEVPVPGDVGAVTADRQPGGEGLGRPAARIFAWVIARS